MTRALSPAGYPRFLAELKERILAVHSSPEFLAQAARDLLASTPWGHHVLMMGKLPDPAARLYYLRATAHLGWSRSVLLKKKVEVEFNRMLEQIYGSP